MTIGIIGAGNMGSAICRALIKSEHLDPDDILVCDTNAEKCQQLEHELQVSTSANSGEGLQKDLVILAIKPQGFEDFASEHQGAIPSETILISIMAGVKLKTLHEKLSHRKVVRAMPNTPALVQEGVTGWFCGENLIASEKDQVQNLLSCLGYSLPLSEESQLDDLTVISGCGPGFFFRLYEAWEKAALSFNLPPGEVKEILLKTLKGSISLLESSTDTPAELKAKVASKGGVTEAGLKVIDEHHPEALFTETLKTAYQRNIELG